MAKCTKCNKGVGCCCNLIPDCDKINGVCAQCYEEQQALSNTGEQNKTNSDA